MAHNASARLKAIGMPDEEIKNTLRNEKFTSRLVDTINAAGCPLEFADVDTGTLWKARGPLLQKIAQKELPHAEKLIAAVGDGSIRVLEQLEAAIEFVTKRKLEDISDAEFSEAAGVGVEVSDHDIQAAVDGAIVAQADAVRAKGLKALGVVLQAAKESSTVMKFASRKKLSEFATRAIKSFVPQAAPSPAAPADGSGPPPAAVEPDEEAELDFQGIVARFPSPQDNAMDNDPEVQERCMAATGGRYMTRFPPEPNGWLHIGHAKAMFLDYGLAELKDGHCYMRFDDTNPSKEKDEFIEGIKYDVEWMGFKWWKLTHTSDYFQELYDFAVQLIKSGRAYVCHQKKAEVKEFRSQKIPSPWRDRPVAESLREFELMKCGFYAPSEATLRLKMDYLSDNPNMHDQVAYRVLYHPHPRTGDKWCIYPTYDYSHCVIDSLENVSHSLCTLEFENRRQSYYWVLDALGIYKPFVWEFSRLNLNYTVMSKRRLQTLVERKYVSGWDDPRMPTIAGLRRRGFTPSGIRAFVKSVGYTRNVKSTIDYGKLEFVQSQELDETSPRAFCVVDPLRVEIVDFPHDVAPVAEGLLFPKRPDAGRRALVLTPVVLIERDDFSEIPPKGWKRLKLGGVIGLKYANLVIKCIEVVKDADRIAGLRCQVVPGKPPKGTTYVHWVADGAAPAEIRLYSRLFRSADPMAVQGDWTRDLDPDSKIVVTGRIEKPLESARPGDRFQFERLGYFVVDPDSTPQRLVFNRTIALRTSFEQKTD
jgi:glutaminyl-tRNA synthetase